MPGRRSGQVVVEMLLILPVFLAMVFLIMETGNISFRLIVLNHATYEVARIGGMTWSNPAAGNPAKMQQIMTRILRDASVDCVPQQTLRDDQANQMNSDLVCAGTEDAKLIFPISSIILKNGSTADGQPARRLKAVVRMPIEKPLMQ